MTTTTNLIELRKLAEAAHPEVHGHTEQWFTASALHLNFGFSSKNSAFIAAANPEKIIGLLNAIKAQAKQIEALQADAESMNAALLKVARMAEELKLTCGMDPESRQAIRNGEYMNISYVARAARKGNV